MTGLRNFFQWDTNWGLLRRSDFELTYLLEKWELGAAALGAPERLRELNELTAAMRDAAEAIRREESRTFFGSLKFPGGPD